MAELHVQNVPPDLLKRLSEQAASHGRSVSEEAIVLLRESLSSTGQTARRRTAIERLEAIRDRARLPIGAPTAEELIREDRDAR